MKRPTVSLYFTWANYCLKMCEFRDEVKDSDYYLDWYSPKGSCHLVERKWVTHLLRMVIANCEVERIRRAKNTPNIEKRR